jgi:uncharacterized protein
MAPLRKQVRVKPNAKQSALTEAADGSLIARLTAPPVEGKANQELIALLARTYGVPKSRVRLIRGATSPHKVVEIDLE